MGLKQTQTYQSLQTVLFLWSIFKYQRDYLFVQNLGSPIQQAAAGRPIGIIKGLHKVFNLFALENAI